MQIASASDVNNQKIIAKCGMIWGADKIATLGGLCTELCDEDNVLATQPTEEEPEPSTIIATLSKGYEKGRVAYIQSTALEAQKGIN